TRARLGADGRMSCGRPRRRMGRRCSWLSPDRPELELEPREFGTHVQREATRVPEVAPILAGTLELEVHAARVVRDLSGCDGQWGEPDAGELRVDHVANLFHRPDLRLPAEATTNLLGRDVGLDRQHERGRRQEGSIRDRGDTDAVLLFHEWDRDRGLLEDHAEGFTE